MNPKSSKQKSKSVKLSKTAIGKILQSAKFDPRKPGPMKVVVDVGDANYYLASAGVLIEEVRQMGCTGPSARYWRKSRKALQLIDLAMFHNPCE